MLMVYVDGMILAGDDMIGVERLEKSLALEIEIKDLGPLRYFLSLEIARSRQGIVVSQQKYILDLLKETRMSGCKSLRLHGSQFEALGRRKCCCWY